MALFTILRSRVPATSIFRFVYTHTRTRTRYEVRDGISVNVNRFFAKLSTSTFPQFSNYFDPVSFVVTVSAGIPETIDTNADGISKSENNASGPVAVFKKTQRTVPSEQRDGE